MEEGVDSIMVLGFLPPYSLPQKNAFPDGFLKKLGKKGVGMTTSSPSGAAWTRWRTSA